MFIYDLLFVFCFFYNREIPKALHDQRLIPQIFYPNTWNSIIKSTTKWSIIVFLLLFFWQQTFTDSYRLCKPRWWLCVHVYDKRRLFPSTTCQTIRPYVLRPRNMNNIWVDETASQKLDILQVAIKCWWFLWFRNHLHQLGTIRRKRNLKLP